MAKPKTRKEPKKRKRYLNALYKKGNLGSRRWKIDFDYIHKLNDKEKEALNDFIEEYYLANFAHTGKKKYHKTKEEKRKIYYENNVSNRCVMSLHNSKGKATTSVALTLPDKVNDLVDMRRDKSSYENALVEYLDYKIFGITDYDPSADD